MGAIERLLPIEPVRADVAIPGDFRTTMSAARVQVSAAHIVVCFHDFSTGGTERIALTLAREWVRQGRRVTILCGSAQGALRPSVDPRVRVVELDPPIGRSALSRVALGPAMARVLPSLGADAVFIPGNFHFGIAHALKRAAPQIPVVAKVSNPLLPKLPRPLAAIARAGLAQYVRPIDRLVYMAPELAEEGRAHLPASSSAVIAEPVLPRGFIARQRRRLGNIPLFVAIGRLEPQKNLALALRAFAELLRIRPARLLVLGEGPERPKLEALARQLELTDHLSMPGFCQNVAQPLSEASALLMTSRFEGYPAVVVEALAADVPVVTTDCSASLHSLISSPLHGAIVPDPSPVLLAHALAEASEQPFTSGGVRPASVAHIDAEASATAYLAMFDSLVDERRTSIHPGKGRA